MTFAKCVLNLCLVGVERRPGDTYCSATVPRGTEGDDCGEQATVDACDGDKCNDQPEEACKDTCWLKRAKV